MAKDY